MRRPGGLRLNLSATFLNAKYQCSPPRSGGNRPHAVVPAQAPPVGRSAWWQSPLPGRRFPGPAEAGRWWWWTALAERARF